MEPADDFDSLPQKRTVIFTATKRNKKRRRGAQVGNKNAQKHGLYARDVGSGISWALDKHVRQFQARLEMDVRNRHGEISTLHESLINEALRCERESVLLNRWLEKSADWSATRSAKSDGGTSVAVTQESGLTLLDRAGILAQIRVATRARNAVIRELLSGSGESGGLMAMYRQIPCVQVDGVPQNGNSGHDDIPGETGTSPDSLATAAPASTPGEPTAPVAKDSHQNGVIAEVGPQDAPAGDLGVGAAGGPSPDAPA